MQTVIDILHHAKSHSSHEVYYRLFIMKNPWRLNELFHNIPVGITAVRIRVYKTRAKSVVACGNETWAVAAMDMKRLGTWERKITRMVLEQWQNKEL